MTFRLVYLDLTLARSDGQGEGNAYFYYISKMVTDRDNLTVVIKYEVAYTGSPSAYSKDQLGRWNGMSPSILVFLLLLFSSA